VTLEGHSHLVSSLAWSSEGGLASGAGDGTIIVWDLERGQPKLTFRDENPDGISLFVQLVLREGGFTGIGGIISVLPGSITDVAWLSNEQLLSSSLSGAVILWDLESGESDIVRNAMGMENIPSLVITMALSQNRKLALGKFDGTIEIWNLEEDILEMTWGAYEGELVNSIAWSQDGWLASASFEGVLVWDLKSSKDPITFPGRSGSSTRVAWSPDGRLASGQLDGTIFIGVPNFSQVDPEMWLIEQCQLAGRNLTEAEWKLYFPGETYRKTCEQWPLETPN
jgi:WD40 repeat protein